MSVPFASCLALACALPLGISRPSRLSPEVYDFAFAARGGVTLAASGAARFGMVDATSDTPRFFSLTLGTAGENGAVVFTRLSPDAPLAGKYPVRSWDVNDNGTGFRALFIAGTAANPQGVFWAESGTVTIRSTRPDAIEGTFTLKARGFLAQDPENENVRVTLHGTFIARGSTMIAQVTDVS